MRAAFRDTEPLRRALGVPLTAAEFLRSRGHQVDETDIPGLFRVDGGPEVTLNQLRQIARDKANG